MLPDRDICLLPSHRLQEGNEYTIDPSGSRLFLPGAIAAEKLKKEIKFCNFASCIIDRFDISLLRTHREQSAPSTPLSDIVCEINVNLMKKKLITIVDSNDIRVHI
jgi:hypothetical protein